MQLLDWPSTATHGSPPPLPFIWGKVLETLHLGLDPDPLSGYPGAEEFQIQWVATRKIFDQSKLASQEEENSAGVPLNHSQFLFYEMGGVDAPGLARKL